MQGKKRLLFVIPAMTGGGAERVCLNILNYLDFTRYSVMLVCFNMEGVYIKKIPPDVLMVNLYKKNKFDFFRLIRDLRYEIKQFRADIVMSFMHYTNIIAALAVFPMRPRPGLIVCEHNYPPKYLPNVRFGFIKRMLMRYTYHKADRVIAISPPIQAYLLKTFNLPEKNVRLIPNPIPVAAIEKDAREALKHPLFNSKEEPWFIACGRLTHQKRFDRLLDAFAIVCQKVRSRLIILGQGGELFNLENQSTSLGIRSLVHFVGFQENPHAWFRRSDALVLSSDYEGFPMNILEAFACGTPVVSTDCPSGPREIINPGVNGYLAEMTSEALATEMLKIVQKPERNESLSRQALETADQFDVSKIVPLYENIFEASSR